jgi:hypothetical protein
MPTFRSIKEHRTAKEAAAMLPRTEDERQRAGRAIGASIAGKKLTVQAFAERQGLDPRTVKGAVEGRTIRADRYALICQGLGLTIADLWAFANPQSNVEYAAASMGGYKRSDLPNIQGEYVTFRRDFRDEARLIAWRTTINWDSQRGGFYFVEDNRPGKAQHSQAIPILLVPAQFTGRRLPTGSL